MNTEKNYSRLSSILKVERLLAARQLHTNCYFVAAAASKKQHTALFASLELNQPMKERALFCRARHRGQVNEQMEAKGASSSSSSSSNQEAIING